MSHSQPTMQSGARGRFSACDLTISEAIVTEVRRQRELLDSLPRRVRVTAHLNLQDQRRPVVLEVVYKCVDVDT